MSEREVIERTRGLPLTVATLAHQLRRLGVREGSALLVHISLSRLGWVCGGPVAVIDALEDVLGPSGTLVFPTHSSDLSDPALWENPPVPESWWKTIRNEMPAYRPEVTPTLGMGAVAECFRRVPGTLRSPHPQVSFAASGPRASEITAAHALDYGLGDDSPLGRLYELGAEVLLLGVGHESNTALHLAEHRAEYPSKSVQIQGAPILVEGERRWVEIQDLALRGDDFPEIGAAFEPAARSLRRGTVGTAEARLFSLPEIVDFAVRWMEEYRP